MWPPENIWYLLPTDFNFVKIESVPFLLPMKKWSKYLPSQRLSWYSTLSVTNFLGRPKGPKTFLPHHFFCSIKFSDCTWLHFQERHSYRAPSATSRYMQAAEAYAAKSRASRSNSGSGGPGPAGPSVGTGGGGGGGGTWSAGSLSSNRGRSRPQLTNETFQRPPSRGYNSRPASRTTSASPGPLRRRQPSDLESKQSSSR